MATGLVASFANEILNFAFRSVSFTPATTYYMKLHTAEPGAAGATAAAGNTTRKAVTFGSTASGGNLANTVAVAWDTSEVTTAETYSHFSLWDAATSGNCKATGTFPVPRAVTSGATFTIPIGDVDITFTIAT